MFERETPKTIPSSSHKSFLNFHLSFAMLVLAQPLGSSHPGSLVAIACKGAHSIAAPTLKYQ
jgi:hypothetical protein